MHHDDQTLPEGSRNATLSRIRNIYHDFSHLHLTQSAICQPNLWMGSFIAFVILVIINESVTGIIREQQVLEIHVYRKGLGLLKHLVGFILQSGSFRHVLAMGSKGL